MGRWLISQVEEKESEGRYRAVNSRPARVTTSGRSFCSEGRGNSSSGDIISQLRRAPPVIAVIDIIIIGQEIKLSESLKAFIVLDEEGAQIAMIIIRVE